MTADFFIRRTEVPNRLYLQFLREEMSGDLLRVRRIGNQIWFYPNLVEPVEDDSLPQKILDTTISAIFVDGDTLGVSPEDRDLPVVGVSWYGAKAYAERYGLRLPTEHEWEIAAKGELSTYLYPWGMTITPDQANYNDPANPFRGLRPIGSYPAATSPFGLLDLCGNAKEWVSDWYGLYLPGQQSNPGGPIEPIGEFGAIRVLRGGSYLNTAAGVRVTAREAAEPTSLSEQIGFRTAYTAPQE
jgi:formylglycine-generating enzyme required for sulfatase activity